MISGDSSLARVLLVFYMILASGYTSDLLGKQFKSYIKENRVFQHIIAFIMMFVLIIVIGGVTDNFKAVMYSVFGYIWFLFMTKMDIQWNIIIMGGLLLFILYENNSDNTKKYMDDSGLFDDKDMEIVEINSGFSQNYVYIGIISLTLLGIYLYLAKKEGQYGGGKFDIIKFMLY